MLFSLDVIRARKGDCLMLHFGDPATPRLALIDGGPKSVYGSFLRPRIEQIRAARGIDEKKSLIVDLLMVSHIDDDHIQGILDLTRDLRDAKENQKHGIVEVRSFWHNSFDDVLGSEPKQLKDAFKTQFGEASLEGNPPSDMTLDLDEEEVVITSALKVLASVTQGAQLRHDADLLKFAAHPEVKEKLIIARAGAKAVTIRDGLTFTIIGPMFPEIEKLHADHVKWLEELKKAGKTPEDVLTAYVDKSVPNLSSIVVLAEMGGKKILLTGDARGDKVLEGMEMVGLLKKGEKIHIDILKAPHHGSSNNLADDFFERIIADHYVFSGDGEHGNPERETLEMLLKARKDDDKYEVHLTYPVDDIDKERKKDWAKEQNKEKKKKTPPKNGVRRDWDPKEHGLVALLDGNPKFKAKFRILEEGKPHVIDLGDKAF